MQKMKIIIFASGTFLPSLTDIKTDGYDTLFLSTHNTHVFKDTGYHQPCIAGLLCFARGVPTNQWSKIFYHFTCSL